MSASDTAGTREQIPPQSVTEAKRPGSRWFGRLARHLANIYLLIIKELRGIRADPILLALIGYAFTIAIYAVATGASTEAKNLSVGIVDEDRSDLTRRIADGLTPPTFKPAVAIYATEIERSMNEQRFIFVIEFPPKFQEDVLSGRQPTVQINIDATAVAQAYNGMIYIQNIIANYVLGFVTGREGLGGAPMKIVVRTMFNPNSTSSWFTSVMQVISNVTLLTVTLVGAALIREREQGTVEHLLVMPVVPTEIMLSKMIANGSVVLAAAMLSMLAVVEWWLEVPVVGSKLLFFFGACFFAFAIGALSIFLGTIAATMGQYGLLSLPIILIMMLLSGATTPMESMPLWLQYVMKTITPMPHFVEFAQNVLFRGAGLSIVWPQLLAMTAIGAVYFGFALHRFRRVIFSQ
jgi:ABC-2 type transport system permease protein